MQQVFEPIIVTIGCNLEVVTGAAMCGTELVMDTVTDAALCGMATVTSAAECGWTMVTSATQCGWDTVTGGLVTGNLPGQHLVLRLKHDVSQGET